MVSVYVRNYTMICGIMRIAYVAPLNWLRPSPDAFSPRPIVFKQNAKILCENDFKRNFSAEFCFAIGIPDFFSQN